MAVTRLRIALWLVVLGFSTKVRAAVPVMTTTAASSITSTSALLNGSGNPGGESTTGWFRLATTNPGTCTDTFGTRVPSTSGTDLGSGSAAVAYSITGAALLPGTTYYFCAIASNASGTSFGGVMSFTTPAAPAVTTSAASAVGTSLATLNASANPGGASSTGWFRYAATNPGSCSDSFGTRAPTSSFNDSALGSGTSPVGYSRALAGLTPATTYYYCAIATNSVGTSFGAVLSFTTLAAAPTVTTSAASLITSSSANLNGSANPGGDPTTGWFRYATASPGTCNDTFGTRAPASGGSALGAGVSTVAYTQGVVGLSAGTTYYYCAIAQNSVGTAFGTVLTFVTPLLPAVATAAATAVSSSTATFNGSANPNGVATTGYFRYATVNPGTCDDTFGSRAPVSGGTALGSGASSVAYSQAVAGLSAVTTYYYCAIGTSSAGTSFGAVLSFTTAAAAPAVTTVGVGYGSSSATLNGSASPGGDATTGWFRYATASPGTCNDTFGTRAPAVGGSALGAGTSSVPFSQGLAGITPGTTYYFCAIASNSVGTAFGAVLSFTTLAAAPAVATAAATAVASTAATLNGAVNPGGANTTGWFRYAATDPGTCDDTFGTRAPAAAGSALGAGTSSAPFSQGLTGLSPGATYYYCAIASNSVGTSFGVVLSLTTLALPPAVTTSAATAVDSAGATLNGSANPGGDATTGWFRYATASPGPCNDTFGVRAPSAGGASLGSGTSATGYSQALTTLSPGTTYYYCAIAMNAEGTGFGAMLSFTTIAVAPTATTSAATAVASSSATLDGSANPGGASTTGWFRYATTDPGACSDSFGTRAPASGGSALGSGTSSVAFSQGVTGLSPGTTYYYCAVASNSVGPDFGAVLTFTTVSEAPAVTTAAATAVASTSATLNGSADPGGAATTGFFRYDTTDPVVCNDAFGTRAPAGGGSSLGAGTSGVPFSEGITGLAPATTYHYCAIGENAAGKRFGDLLTLTTGSAPPAVTTAAPTDVTNDSATLNGAAVPNGDATTGWFRYAAADPGACDDAFGTRAPPTGGSALGAGTQQVAFSSALSGLARGTAYYFCAIAENAQGTSFGAVQTAVPGTTSPVVTTEVAAAISGSGATLAGTAAPRGAAAVGWFRYGDAVPSSCDDSFGVRAPATGGTSLGAGASPVPFEEPIAGLEPNLTYYYCAAAANVGGATFGEVRSFDTASLPPVVTTVAATVGADGAVTLEGLANPRGTETTTWFRVGAANPGSCDDAFGTRWPQAGGTVVGAGRANVHYAEVATGLPPGNYFACAIGSNSAGPGVGEVVAFEIKPPSSGGGGCGCGTGSTSRGGTFAVLALAALLLGVSPRPTARAARRWRW
ncbi:MAG TPA: hypothetical protein VLU43_07555 [Anaeromyxobacteraceae bacterium]|nr:hypothetical protein [Anaeromyxobacteraceae bacterium]